MHVLPLSLRIESEQMLGIAKHFSHLPGTCLLYSGGNYACSEKSFLWLFPTDSFSIQGEQTTLLQLLNQRNLFPKDPFTALKNAIGPFSSQTHPEWVGFISYEMGGKSDWECFIDVVDGPLALAYFQKCALIVEYDHRKSSLRLYYENEIEKKYLNNSYWEDLAKKDVSAKEQPCFAWSKPLVSKEKYFSQIAHIQELIRRGDVYQVNLSHEMQFFGKTDPYTVFSDLAVRNPASFSTFMRFADFCIVSSSPERFLQNKNRYLETRPIKGTVARGKTADEDRQNRNNLLTSEKERAELLMITDLSRNDLGKICEVGSVQGQSLFQLESYENVYHMHSVIKGKMKSRIHSVDALRACFPAGSITGCPKLRAQSVIAKVENRSRGIYTGSIGYFSANGDFDFNVAIRTLFFHEDSVSVQLGGAIVIDSDPEKEYEETMHKGVSILNTLGMNHDCLA